MRNPFIISILLASCILSACGELHGDSGGGKNCTETQMGCEGTTQMRLSVNQGIYDANSDQHLFTYLAAVDPRKVDRIELLMGVLFASRNGQVYSKMTFTPSADLQVLPIGCSVNPGTLTASAQFSDASQGVLASTTNQTLSYAFNPNINSNAMLTVLLPSLAAYKNCTNLMLQVVMHGRR